MNLNLLLYSNLSCSTETTTHRKLVNMTESGTQTRNLTKIFFKRVDFFSFLSIPPKDCWWNTCACYWKSLCAKWFNLSSFKVKFNFFHNWSCLCVKLMHYKDSISDFLKSIYKLQVSGMQLTFKTTESFVCPSRASTFDWFDD